MSEHISVFPSRNLFIRLYFIKPIKTSEAFTKAQFYVLNNQLSSPVVIKRTGNSSLPTFVSLWS